jgi:O-antigen/teichoic acid export membrane protein
MTAESLQFFGVSLATRAFQAFPVIVIDRALGPEVVGILGAFGRIVEMVSLPLAIVANALAVRAHEMLTQGAAAVEKYWTVIARMSVMACIAAGGFWLMAGDLALLIIPESPDAPELFQWMALLLVARAVADLFVPASDYVGGLGRRVVFLAVCAVVQVPFIWLGARGYGALGAVAAVIAAHALMIGGYVVIAKRAFFGTGPAPLPIDVPIALLACVIISAACARLVVPLREFLSNASVALAPWTAALLLYVAVFGVVFLAVPMLRRVYPSLRFLELE